ncbi:MAG TPA: DUF4412 domain-containing protein [Arachidicoccus sp.]
MKKYVVVYFLMMLSCAKSFAQKVAGDCTITYKVSAADATLDSNVINDAYKKFYVSGGKALTEISFSGFNQQTFYNENNDNVYILYLMNGQKYMRLLTKEQWKEQYKNYKDAKLQTLDKTEKILGYTCKKAIATLRDGTTINLYYTSEIKTNIAENPYEFDNINGLVLKYEAEIQHKYKITYTASSIDFNPVPAEKFTLPKQGYRMLNNNHQ